ncbi:MAG: PPC domain-containing protein, partial [Planctomycetota bacterium]
MNHHALSCRAEALEPRRLLTAIASNESIESSIAVVGEVDEYTFNVAAGREFTIALGDLSGSNSIDASLEILDPSGTSVASGSANVGLDRTVVAGSTGTYRAVVRELG